ncbi:MAG: radical SAM protein [Psychrilyobacter sp.]|uniref:radical SAM protein n=1 Tax=Psychrilyobacter sp. TaxID=2586924 RepID=UPI003C70E9EF
MYKYIFGPVPSRRLGVSLGVDLVMSKTCNLNCIYCECGSTTKFYNMRDSYIDINKLVEELKDVLQNLTPDYITFSGSGEPTLNKDLGTIIKKVRKIYSGKIAVITNSSLLNDLDVRESLEEADLIIPSLDAVSEDIFKRMNRPIEGLSIKNILEGMTKFLSTTKKDVYLEIFIVEGINDSVEELENFVEYLKDKKITTIQLNTLARPGAIKEIKPASIKRLSEIREYFISSGLKSVEIIKKYTSREELPKYSDKLEELILNMLNKRKYSIDEMVELLQRNEIELFKYFNILQKEGKIKIVVENDQIYIKS